MSAYKIPTPGNYPEESTKHSEHGEILKSRRFNLPFFPFLMTVHNRNCIHFLAVLPYRMKTDWI